MYSPWTFHVCNVFEGRGIGVADNITELTRFEPEVCIRICNERRSADISTDLSLQWN